MRSLWVFVVENEQIAFPRHCTDGTTTKFKIGGMFCRFRWLADAPRESARCFNFDRTFLNPHLRFGFTGRCEWDLHPSLDLLGELRERLPIQCTGTGINHQVALLERFFIWLVNMLSREFLQGILHLAVLDKWYLFHTKSAGIICHYLPLPASICHDQLCHYLLLLSSIICCYLLLSAIICHYLPLSTTTCCHDQLCHYLPVLSAIICCYLPLSAMICHYLPHAPSSW